MSGGRRPYRKGVRAERELARRLGGERVPLSGAAGGRYAGDVVALGLTWQVKVEAGGWRRLYRWLETADALALKADRRPCWWSCRSRRSCGSWRWRTMRLLRMVALVSALEASWLVAALEALRRLVQ